MRADFHGKRQYADHTETADMGGYKYTIFVGWFYYTRPIASLISAQ
jgi:hypothetical protein